MMRGLVVLMIALALLPRAIFGGLTAVVVMLILMGRL